MRAEASGWRTRAGQRLRKPAVASLDYTPALARSAVLCSYVDLALATPQHRREHTLHCSVNQHWVPLCKSDSGLSLRVIAQVGTITCRRPILQRNVCASVTKGTNHRLRIKLGMCNGYVGMSWRGPTRCWRTLPRWTAARLM